MSRNRVSLKGRGADIFFGEEPHSTSPTPPAPTTEAAPAPEPAAPAHKPERKRASGLGRKNARISGLEHDAGEREQGSVDDHLLDNKQDAPQATGLASVLASPEEPLSGINEAIAINPASMLASYRPELITGIRRIVRTPGREVSFVRLTPEEKGRLADIVYTYKRRGWKTSENEINRIAVNFLLAEYEASGELSLLAQVLRAIYTD